MVNRDARENGEFAYASAKAVGREMEKRKGKMGRTGGAASRCEIPVRDGAGAKRKTADWSVEFKQEV